MEAASQPGRGSQFSFTLPILFPFSSPLEGEELKVRGFN
jgi:hypothetical protein